MNRRSLCLVLYDGFAKCPTTGRILELLKGDDKAICYCGKSNPKVPKERNEETHTHLVRFLEPAMVDDFLSQEKLDGKEEMDE